VVDNCAPGPSASSAAVAVSSFVVDAGGSRSPMPRAHTTAPVLASTTSPSSRSPRPGFRAAGARSLLTLLATGAGASVASGLRAGARGEADAAGCTAPVGAVAAVVPPWFSRTAITTPKVTTAASRGAV
jgi:hypothetical protein